MNCAASSASDANEIELGPEGAKAMLIKPCCYFISAPLLGAKAVLLISVPVATLTLLLSLWNRGKSDAAG